MGSVGDTSQGITLYNQALTIVQDTGDRRSELRVLNNLGTVWMTLGDARQAVNYFDQALAIARETGDRHYEGWVINSLGAAWAAIGDTRQGITLSDQALAINRETGDRRGEAHDNQPGNWVSSIRGRPSGHRLLRPGPGHRTRDRRPPL